MKSQRSKEGELVIDHRASPGLPADFYHKIGLTGPASPGGAVQEMPTMTCCHCNAVVIMNPERTRSRGFCRKCDAYVCDGCDSRECRPFAKFLDDAEKLAYRAQQQNMKGVF